MEMKYKFLNEQELQVKILTEIVEIKKLFIELIAIIQLSKN